MDTHIPTRLCGRCAEEKHLQFFPIRPNGVAVYICCACQTETAKNTALRWDGVHQKFRIGAEGRILKPKKWIDNSFIRNTFTNK